MGQRLGLPFSKKKANKAHKRAKNIGSSVPNVSCEPEDTRTPVDPRTLEAPTTNPPASNDRVYPAFPPPFRNKFQGELANKLRARRSSYHTVDDSDRISDVPIDVSNDGQIKSKPHEANVTPDLVGMQHKLAVARHLNRRPPTRGNTPKATLVTESAEATGDLNENACAAFFNNPSVTSTPLTATKLKAAIEKHDQFETPADSQTGVPTTTVNLIDSPVTLVEHDSKIDENLLNPSPHETIESKSVVPVSPVRKQQKISGAELTTNTQPARPRTFSLTSTEDASIAEGSPRSERYSTTGSVKRVLSSCDDASTDRSSPVRVSHSLLEQRPVRVSNPLKKADDHMQVEWEKVPSVKPQSPLTVAETIEPVNGNSAVESDNLDSVSTRAQVFGAKLHSPKASTTSPDTSSKSDDSSQKLRSNVSDPNKRSSKVFELRKSFENPST